MRDPRPTLAAGGRRARCTPGAYDLARPDRESRRRQRVLGVGVAQFLEAKDVGGGHRSGAPFGDAGGEMREAADTAAGDDRYMHALCHAADQLGVVARALAVAIDRIEEDLAGPERGDLRRPALDRFAGGPRAAIAHDLVLPVGALRRVD